MAIMVIASCFSCRIMRCSSKRLQRKGSGDSKVTSVSYILNLWSSVKCLGEFSSSACGPTSNVLFVAHLSWLVVYVVNR